MEQPKIVCLSSAYLAPVQYYAQFVKKDVSIFVERYDNYVKQSYRNRCIIMDANGPIALTVPTISISKKKIQMKDVQISDHGNWQHVHWNAIKSAYNSSPFFEYYKDDFAPFYHTKYKYLFDFNEQLQFVVLDALNIERTNISKTEEYIVDYSIFKNKVVDLREVIHPKTEGSGGDNISSIVPRPYYQVFADRNGFVSNLSIIDLLFNMGNESLLILHESVSQKQ